MLPWHFKTVSFISCFSWYVVCSILFNAAWLLLWKEDIFPTDFLDSSSPVSPGGFLLCFLLCFSSSLPRILDYWVRYKLNGDDLSSEHLAAWFPWYFLCVKALLKCMKGKIWKYWLLLSPTMKCVKLLVHEPCSPYWQHMNCLFQLLHHLHHVPCLLSGVGQRC